MKKSIKIASVIVIGGITLFVLFHTVINWTGAREWERVSTLLQDNGVELGLSAYALGPVPAEDNFFSNPLMASISNFEPKLVGVFPESSADDSDPVYKDPESRERFLRMKLPSSEGIQGVPRADWRTGREVNMELFQRILDESSAEHTSIADWLSTFEADIEEIDRAAMRPEAVMPFHWQDSFIDNVSMLMPELNDLRHFSRFQAFRVYVAIENDDHQSARSALRTLYQVYRASATQPTLVGFLVGAVNLDMYLSAIWQGMQDQFWTAEELTEIDEQLSRVNHLDNLERAITVEMILFQIGGSDYIKNISWAESKSLVSVIGGIGEDSSNPAFLGIGLGMAPGGTWDHNKAFGCRMLYDHGIRPIRERRLPDPEAFENELEKSGFRHILAKISLPTVHSIIEKGFQYQVSIELALLACAVERFYLDQGSFPHDLATLVPDYIEAVPEDLMSPGNLLRYSKGQGPGKYRIYSVGKNQVDDGGEVAFKKGGKRNDPDKGDWVWSR